MFRCAACPSGGRFGRPFCITHLFSPPLIPQAVAYIHIDGVFHGQLTLENVPLGCAWLLSLESFALFRLLTAEQRPILTEFGPLGPLLVEMTIDTSI